MNDLKKTNQIIQKINLVRNEHIYRNKYFHLIKIKQLKNNCIVCKSHKNSKKRRYLPITFRKKLISLHKLVFEFNLGRKLKYDFTKNSECVLHKCNNNKCINVNHLYLGNYKKNYADGVNANRNSKGEKNGQSKLTKQKVKKMRLMWKSKKYTLQEIGDFFDVTKQNAWFCVKRKTWKHIR